MGGRSSGNESSDVLSEAAAEVEEGLRGLETRDERLKERVLDYGEIKEAEFAYTGVWVDGPGAIALDSGRAVSIYGQWSQYGEALSWGLDRLLECAGTTTGWRRER